MHRNKWNGVDKEIITISEIKSSVKAHFYGVIANFALSFWH